jgi:hypothetical protein
MPARVDRAGHDQRPRRAARCRAANAGQHAAHRRVCLRRSGAAHPLDGPRRRPAAPGGAVRRARPGPRPGHPRAGLTWLPPARSGSRALTGHRESSAARDRRDARPGTQPPATVRAPQGRRARPRVPGAPRTTGRPSVCPAVDRHGTRRHPTAAPWRQRHRRPLQDVRAACRRLGAGTCARAWRQRTALAGGRAQHHAMPPRCRSAQDQRGALGANAGHFAPR